MVELHGLTVAQAAAQIVGRQLSPVALMEAVLDRIDETFPAPLSQTQVTRADVLDVGFAIAGHRMKNGRYNPPDPLVHWSDVDLAQCVSERFGLTEPPAAMGSNFGDLDNDGAVDIVVAVKITGGRSG